MQPIRNWPTGNRKIRIKKALQSLDSQACQEFAGRAASMTDPQEIEAMCRDYAKQHYPDLFDL